MAREMKDSGIVWVGEIPNSWSIHPVYYYFSERKNKNIFGVESNLLSLSYGQIIRKNINSNEGLLPESFNTYNIVEEDDIIIRPTDLQNDKRSLRTGIVKERGIITSAYISIKATKELNAAYFHYLLYIYDVTKVFYNMGNGVRQGLNFSEFSKLLVIEPPIEEQCKIVTYLDRKCNEINSLTKDIQTQIGILEDYKKSIITEAVTKGLNPDVEMKDSGIEWIGEIPKHWIIIRAKNIVIIGNGSDPKRDGSIPVYGSGANSFKTCGEYKEAPAVLIGRKGATLHIPHYIEERYWNVDTAFDVKEKDNKVILKYYYYNAICFDYKKYISQTTLPSMTQTDYGNMYIPYPQKEEQKDIVDYLDAKCAEIDIAILEKKRQLEVLEQYKKSLIYEYVTGKKEVPNR